MAAWRRRRLGGLYLRDGCQECEEGTAGGWRRGTVSALFNSRNLSPHAATALHRHSSREPTIPPANRAEAQSPYHPLSHYSCLPIHSPGGPVSHPPSRHCPTPTTSMPNPANKRGRNTPLTSLVLPTPTRITIRLTARHTRLNRYPVSNFEVLDPLANLDDLPG